MERVVCIFKWPPSQLLVSQTILQTTVNTHCKRSMTPPTQNLKWAKNAPQNKTIFRFTNLFKGYILVKVISNKYAWSFFVVSHKARCDTGIWFWVCFSLFFLFQTMWSFSACEDQIIQISQLPYWWSHSPTNWKHTPLPHIGMLALKTHHRNKPTKTQ